jgi:hypothetical protein
MYVSPVTYVIGEEFVLTGSSSEWVEYAIELIYCSKPDGISLFIVFSVNLISLLRIKKRVSIKNN